MNYVETPFNYTGSKYKMLDQLLKEFDYTKKYFIDLFVGGGSVAFNICDKYEKILINDIIKDLVYIYKELMDNDDIVKNMRNLIVDKEDYDGFVNLKKSYNENKSSDKLWALMLNSYNNMLRFNQKFEYNSGFGHRGYNDNIDRKINIFKEYIRGYKNKFIFSSVNFDQIKVINKNTMVYIDPPYSFGYDIKKGDKSKLVRTCEAGYNIYWFKEHDEKLYNYVLELDKNKISFCLSGLFEHNGIRSLLLEKLINDGFVNKIMDFNYNGVSKLKIDKKSIEMIIKNY